MRRYVLILIWAVLGLLLLCSQSWAVCPEDPGDNGECDTLYVEIYPGDEWFAPPGPELVRFPIYVTHDVVDPVMDSIASFIIPLCYTSSNANANALIDPAWNNTSVYPWPTADSSVFRHLPDNDTRLVENWMMLLSEALMGREWDTRIIDLTDPGTFRLATFPTGSPDQRFPEGSRVLLATATFTLQDTTTICIDTCFWPPASRLAFGTRGSQGGYVPRHFLPVCEALQWPPGPPVFTVCPYHRFHNYNGTFGSSEFVVETLPSGGEVTTVEAYFEGLGVDIVAVIYWDPPPGDHVEGYVTYEVTDHCQAGGAMVLTAEDAYAGADTCRFDITLLNDPPFFSLPSSWTALAGYTMILKVPAAVDQNGDSVSAVELDAFWFEPDSLQAPTNPPTYNPGDPGSFTWVPEEADTGTWICSFSATDVCGAVYTRQISIQVGLPFCGDCTGEGRVDASDVVYLIGYLFKAGPAPDPPCKGDVTCDGTVEAGDLVYLINYFFRFGPAPCFECCP